MIKIESAFLCNAAELSRDGTLSVLGAWIDSITGPQLPLRQQMTFAARIAVDPDDMTRPHTFTLVVEHSDGTEQLARIEGQTPPTPPPPGFDPELTIGVPLVILLPLEFRRLGVYVVRLLLDGDTLWEKPLRVKTVLPQIG